MKNKLILHICFITGLLLFIYQFGFGQSYSLSPNGAVCSSTTSVTISGSQTGKYYQVSTLNLNSVGNYYSSWISGTGSSISWANVPAMGNCVVYISSGSSIPTTNGGSVVASGAIFYQSAPHVGITATGNASLTTGGSVTLTATISPTSTVTGAWSYLWFLNNRPIQNGPNTPSYTVTSAGNYSVDITGNCSGQMTNAITVTNASDPASMPPAITYPGPQTYYVGSAITTLVPSYSGPPATPPNGQTTTLAGSGSVGFINGTGTGASFSQLLGIAVDASANVYVSDAGNNCIRKITPTGVVTTLAGNGSAGFADGTGTAAKFNHPVGLAVDASGNVYIADEMNQRIRKITPTGVVTTIAGTGAVGAADGPATSATFNSPCGVAVSSDGSTVWVADYNNNKIRYVSYGTVQSCVGTGAAGSANGSSSVATFNHPYSVVCDSYGTLYVADTQNNMIRKVSLGVVSTLAGSTTAGSTNGQGTSASFNMPTTITLDQASNVYVADANNNLIRMITPAGQVTTLSGTGAYGANNSFGSNSSFNYPFAVAVDASGYIYAGDDNNYVVRKVATTAYGISPALPPGMSFNTSTGSITGTPTAVLATANYTITAYNSFGMGSTTLSITVSSSQDNPGLTAGNTVRTDIIKVAGVLNQSQIQTGVNAETEVSYMDGLGRPVQRIEQQASPLQKDIVQIMAYDQYGRQPKQYLPYTATTADGSLQPNAATAQQAFYQVTNQQVAVDAAPYSGTVFDNSPLERVQEKGAAGATWQTGGGHSIKNQFRLNQSADHIMVWNSNGPTNTYYANSQLSVNVMTDENGNQVLTFTNQLGQLVEKKVQAGAGIWLETVFVYDDIGNVLFQVSPEGVRRIYGASPPAFDAAFINTWATSYTYDTKGRMVSKQAPGAAPVYMVYDSYNRLVLMQDGRLRNAYGAADKWYATKYDVNNRVIISGLYTYAAPPNPVGSTNQQIMQNYLDGLVYNNVTVFPCENRVPGTTYGYTNQSFPVIADADVLTVNYYDDYNFYNTTAVAKYFFNGTAAVQYINPNQTNFATTAATDNSGLLTGTMSRVITPAGNNGGWITQAIFYDQYGNPIQQQKNSLASPNTFDITSNLVDIYGGHITQTLQTKAISNTSVLNTVTYDLRDRVTQAAVSINGGPNQVVSKYDYNELGQLKDKGLGLLTAGANSGKYLQTVDYRYNIRGWLTGINNSTLTADNGVTNNDTNDIWGETILYDQADATGLSNTVKYNGKISEIKWQANDLYAPPGNPVRQRSYTYIYDANDRLMSAQYAANSGGGSPAWNAEVGGYNEAVGSYDYNGNIQSLTRNSFASGASAFTQIDNLTYTYKNSNTSNQLDAVTDNATGTTKSMGFNEGANTTGEYQYDLNGNLTADANKNETITYNDLNKVSKIAIAGGPSIQYTYDASGNRIRKVLYNNANTIVHTYDYLDGFVYMDGNLSYFNTAEGRVTSNTAATVFTYNYFIADHLGNTRVSFHDNGSGVAAMDQENEYYPFGMTMQGIVVRTTPVGNKQLFNGGSELQDDLGFENSYSTPYREYDQVLGRFNAIDPMVDKYAGWTPYNFAFNDPAGGNDPGGADGRDIYGNSTFTGCDCEAPNNGTPQQTQSESYWYANAQQGLAGMQLIENLNNQSTQAEIELANDVTSPNFYNSPIFGMQLSNLQTEEIAEQKARRAANSQLSQADAGGNDALAIYHYTEDGLQDVSIIGYSSPTAAQRAFNKFMGLNANQEGEGLLPWVEHANDITGLVGERLDNAKIGIGTGVVTVALSGYEIGKGYKKDGNKIGPNTYSALHKAEGAVIGGYIGSRIGAVAGGAAFGALVGGLTDGIGTEEGIEFGQWVGGIGGGLLGSWIGGGIGELKDSKL